MPDKSGVSANDHDENSFSDTVSDRKLAELRDEWKNVIFLVLEECSMISNEMLFRIHLRLNLIFGYENDPDCYFGKICLLLVGDFCQLKPVVKPYMFADSTKCPLNLFTMLFHPVFLKTIHRQGEDKNFAEVLNRIRETDGIGDVDSELLMTRHFSVCADEYYPNFQLAPHLFLTRKRSHAHNIKTIKFVFSEESGKEIYLFRATDRIVGRWVKPNHPDEPEFQDESARLLSGDDAEKTGGLKNWEVLAVGFPVLLMMKINTKDGLVNGARGLLIGFEWGNEANTPSPLELTTTESVWTRKWFHAPAKGSTSPLATLPTNVKPVLQPKFFLVRFDADVGIDGGFEKKVDEKGVEYLVVKVAPRSACYLRTTEDKQDVKICRTMTPIDLAYSMTVHKAQGMTLHQVVVHLSYENLQSLPGAAYVALSRVRNLKQLIILHLDPRAIKSSPLDRFAYNRLRTLPEAGTVGNPLGNSIVDIGEQQRGLEIRLIELENSRADIEKDKKSNEDLPAKDRLRQVEGESKQARQKRLVKERREEKARDKKIKGTTNLVILTAKLAAMLRTSYQEEEEAPNRSTRGAIFRRRTR